MSIVDEKYIPINRYIESKPFVLWWEMDTVMLFGGVFLTGYMFASGIWMLVNIIFAIFVVNIHGKMKREMSKGFYKHLFYRFGFLKTKQLLPSGERLFIGS